MLSPEQWADVERLFDLCSGLPPSERTAFLARECSDENLRREAESLLEHAGGGLPAANAAIASMAAAIVSEPTDPAGSDPLVGSFLGPYKIAGLLARGGMGAVYRAVREDDQFRKQVAIKVIPRVLAGPEAVARFRSERQILANLEHPGIARLLDGGTSEGVPYLVMEYVEGVPITQYVREHRLPIPGRLRLIQSVCAAVTYAHRNLVIHRDLKPANILVTEDGQIRLLDFGLAKLADPALADAPLTSSMIMTPEYASPEQIRGERVTTASDVYSLGVVLYEILAGERPYRITSSTLHELERQVRDTDPRKPSAVDNLPRQIRRNLAGDLDNIVLKALQKDIAHRYGSVEELAEDVRRYLMGLPVRARPATPLYRAGKFVRRHRSVAAVVVVVAASLIAGIVVANREARIARERFDQVREFVRAVLVDIHGQLADIPGAAKTRQALVAYVDDYLKRVAAQHAGDDRALAPEFATTYLRLGQMQGATTEAVASFQKGRLLLERMDKNGNLGAADSLILARLRLAAGSALLDLGENQQGFESLAAAIDLAGRIRETTGRNGDAELVRAAAHCRLARYYRVQYKLPQAEQHAREAIAAAEEVVRRGNRTNAAYEALNDGRNVLAGVLRRQGRWQQSMELYQSVLDDTERRAGANPQSVGLQRELARSHQILGDMVAGVPGHSEDELLFHVRSAIAIAERLAAADPFDKTAQTELGEYLSSGAEALFQPAQREEGLRYLRRALPLFENVLKAEPGNGMTRLYAALTEADMSKFLGRKGDLRDSIAWLRRGLADLSSLVDGDPKNTLNKLEYIKVQRWLADALARDGQAREALALAQDGIASARAVAGDVSGPESWRELPRAYSAMAETCRVLGKGQDARRWYRLALEEWKTLRSKGALFPDSAEEIAEAQKGAGI